MKIISTICFLFFFLFNKGAYSTIVEVSAKGINIEYLHEHEAEIEQLQYVVIDKVMLNGNNITKPHIIFRELLFEDGDTLSVSDFERILAGSRENLLNTSLFNFVEIFASLNHANLSVVNIVFVERWYLWPFPTLDIHERNVNTWLENPGFSRISYGVYVVRDNFRGRKERLRFNFRTGYNERYDFSYSIPYLNYKQQWGMTISSGIIRSREVNYISTDNKQVFYKDFDNPIQTSINAQINFNYRKDYYLTHNLHLRYNWHSFADTILVLNPRFTHEDNTIMQYLELRYDLISDHRDIKAYPLKGYYNSISVIQQGFNTFENDISPVFSILNSYRKYWDLNNHWYYAISLNSKVSISEEQSYFLQQGLGYRNNFVRGYEYYVVDGQHYAVFKTNIKYNIVPQRIQRIGFIPGDKFGLLHYAIFVNAFADAGYVYDRFFFENNPYSNHFLAGAGIGIDFVTYYDKVFRTEFTINRHGRFDVYFHLISPI